MPRPPTDHRDVEEELEEPDRKISRERPRRLGRSQRQRRSTRGRQTRDDGKNGMLEKIATLLAGLATLCLLLGFPAVAWQFSRFGVPLDLAPDRDFLIAGVPPTLAFILGEVLSQRVPRVSLNEGAGSLELLSQMGVFSLPLLLLWGLMLGLSLLVYAAFGHLAGGAVRAALGLGNGAHFIELLLCPALLLVVQILLWRSKRKRLTSTVSVVLWLGTMEAALYGARVTGWQYWALPVVFGALPLCGVMFLGVVKLSGQQGALMSKLSASSLAMRWLALLPVVTTALLSVPIGAALALSCRAALIVLKLVPASAQLQPWLAAGALVGLLATYGQAAMFAGMLEQQEELVSVWQPWRATGPSGRFMRWAHALFVAALMVVHALGVFSYLPRTALGGRPPCVSGTAQSPVPGGKPMPLASATALPSWSFARLCVMTLTEHDVVLCDRDLPPASCVVLKRADVTTLASRSN